MNHAADEVPPADGKSLPTSADGHSNDAEEGLHQELMERQAVIRRQQGENFLLATQVKQLEQQIMDASKDAQACSSQLAQVLQLMDSTGGRVPLKGEVDRARALVTAARRTIRRVACWSSDERVEIHSGTRRDSTQGSATLATAHAAAHPANPTPRGNGSASDRRPSPHGRPRSPRSEVPPAQLAASAAAALGEADGKPYVNGTPPAAAAGSATRSLSEARPAGRTKAAAKERSRRTRDRVNSGGPSEAEAALLATGGSDQTPVDAAAQAALREELAEVQQHVARQRELLLRAVRRGAQLEEAVSTSKDESIRKDVIIYNLRQEVSGVQSELKQQQAQFEQHMQQIQQQHLQQLQQQACQIQELQLLQIQRLQQSAHTEPEPILDASLLQRAPSFGSRPPETEASIEA